MCLGVSALLLSLTGCFGPGDNREALNAFALAYVGFHKAVDDSEVSMWVIALDVSGDRHTTAYRQNFLEAFDTHNTNRRRAENAKQAVLAREESNPVLDDFDMRNDKCDAKSLAMVEAANAIRDNAYRKQAVSLAGDARDIPAALGQMKMDYSQIYTLQVNLASELAANSGYMRAILPQMKRMVPEQKKLLEETDRLRDKLQTSVRAMETQYAAIKGMTGITIDYVPSTDGDGAKQP
jgi:chemotaxis protein histidine kinase CheA